MSYININDVLVKNRSRLVGLDLELFLKNPYIREVTISLLRREKYVITSANKVLNRAAKKTTSKAKQKATKSEQEQKKLEKKKSHDALVASQKAAAAIARKERIRAHEETSRLNREMRLERFVNKNPFVKATQVFADAALPYATGKLSFADVVKSVSKVDRMVDTKRKLIELSIKPGQFSHVIKFGVSRITVPAHLVGHARRQALREMTTLDRLPLVLSNVFRVCSKKETLRLKPKDDLGVVVGKSLHFKRS